MPTPLPANMMKIVWQFDLLISGAVSETAEFGVWWIKDDFGTPPETLEDLQAIAEAAYGSWTDNMPATWYPTSLRLTSAQASTLSTAGLTEQLAVYVPPSSPWVGETSGSLPWQMSMAVGLYSYTPGTFIPNQRRRRGRVFLPPFALARIGSTPNGVMASGDVLDTVEAVRDLLADVATFESPNSGTGQLPCVCSREAVASYVLTDIVSDQVLDTQRRRTKSELRARQAVAWTV